LHFPPPPSSSSHNSLSIHARYPRTLPQPLSLPILPAILYPHPLSSHAILTAILARLANYPLSSPAILNCYPQQLSSHVLHAILYPHPLSSHAILTSYPHLCCMLSSILTRCPLPLFSPAILTHFPHPSYPLSAILASYLLTSLPLLTSCLHPLSSSLTPLRLFSLFALLAVLAFSLRSSHLMSLPSVLVYPTNHGFKDLIDSNSI
jgi:hypothetical protein